MLSYMLKCEGFVGSLVDRKKKKKSLEYHASNSPYDMICKKENTFSFLSSVLDILLLKKDMANRCFNLFCLDHIFSLLKYLCL